MLKDDEGDAFRAPLRQFSLFDPGRYLALHSDLRAAGVDPLDHFVRRGIWERRELAGTDDLAGLLAGLSGDVEAPLEPLPPAEEARILRAIAAREIGIYVNSLGNFFMREMAELTVAGLVSLGAAARLLDENAAIADAPPLRIFVAPHEFFALGRGPDWARKAIVAASFMFSTEQIQTPWFREALPYLLAGRGVIDLNYQNFRLSRQTGKPALFFYPGFARAALAQERALLAHPLAETLPQAARDYDTARDLWAERPLDVVFLGSESPKREAFLAENEAFFARLAAFVQYVRLQAQPIRAEGAETRPALNRYVCRRAKIVLNIHQGDVAYFEWHRMVMQGMWQKALVVSDPCLPHPLFKPGLHYLEAEPHRIPALVEWLIHTREGHATAEQVRHEAFAALVEQASQRRMALHLARFLVDHA